jgi:hypothetical protein
MTVIGQSPDPGDDSRQEGVSQTIKSVSRKRHAEVARRIFREGSFPC